MEKYRKIEKFNGNIVKKRWRIRLSYGILLIYQPLERTFLEGRCHAKAKEK